MTSLKLALEINASISLPATILAFLTLIPNSYSKVSSGTSSKVKSGILYFSNFALLRASAYLSFSSSANFLLARQCYLYSRHSFCLFYASSGVSFSFFFFVGCLGASYFIILCDFSNMAFRSYSLAFYSYSLALISYSLAFYSYSLPFYSSFGSYSSFAYFSVAHFSPLF